MWCRTLLTRVQLSPEEAHAWPIRAISSIRPCPERGTGDAGEELLECPQEPDMVWQGDVAEEEKFLERGIFIAIARTECAGSGCAKGKAGSL